MNWIINDYYLLFKLKMNESLRLNHADWLNRNSMKVNEDLSPFLTKKKDDSWDSWFFLTRKKKMKKNNIEMVCKWADKDVIRAVLPSRLFMQICCWDIGEVTSISTCRVETPRYPHYRRLVVPHTIPLPPLPPPLPLNPSTRIRFLPYSIVLFIQIIIIYYNYY